EEDGGDVADGRAGGQAGAGPDGVAEIAHAAAGAVLGRQEAGQDVGRQAGARVDRLEDGGDHAGWQVDPQLDLHVEGLPVVGHGHGRLEVLAAGRDLQVVVAEADRGQPEGGPVQVRVEWVGDDHALGGGGGRGL